MNVENVFVVTSSLFTAASFDAEAQAFGIRTEKVTTTAKTFSVDDVIKLYFGGNLEILDFP